MNALTQIDIAIRACSRYKGIEDATEAFRYKSAQIMNKYLTEQGLNSTYTYKTTTYSPANAYNRLVLGATSGSNTVSGSLTYGWRAQYTINGTKFWCLDQNFFINDGDYFGGYQLASDRSDTDSSLYLTHYRAIADLISHNCLGWDVHFSSNSNHLDKSTLWGTGFTGTPIATNTMNSCRRRFAELLNSLSGTWLLPDLPAGKVVMPLTKANFVAMATGVSDSSLDMTNVLQLTISDVQKLCKRFGISTIASTAVDNWDATFIKNNAATIRDTLYSKDCWNTADTKCFKIESTCNPDLFTPNIKRSLGATHEPPEGWKYFELNNMRYYYPARFFRYWYDLPDYIKTPIINYYGSYLATSNTGYSSISTAPTSRSNNPEYATEATTGYTVMSSMKLIDVVAGYTVPYCYALRLFCHLLIPEIERMFRLLGVTTGHDIVWRLGTNYFFPHMTLSIRPSATTSPMYHTNSNVSYLKSVKQETSYGTSWMTGSGSGTGAGRMMILKDSDIRKLYTLSSKGTAKPTISYTSTGNYPVVDDNYNSNVFWLLTHEFTHMSRGRVSPGLGGWLNEGMSDFIWGSYDGHRTAYDVMLPNGLFSLGKYYATNGGNTSLHPYRLNGVLQTQTITENNIAAERHGSTSTKDGVVTAKVYYTVTTSFSISNSNKTGEANTTSLSETGIISLSNKTQVSIVDKVITYPTYTYTYSSDATDKEKAAADTSVNPGPVSISYTAIAPMSGTYYNYVGGAQFWRWLIWSVMQGWDKQWADNGHTHFPLDTAWSITKPYYNPSTGNYG